MSVANLFPWRKQQRARCLRFWSVLFTSSLLVTLAALCALRMNSSVTLRALQSDLAGANAVQQALKTREGQWQALQSRPSTKQPLPLAWQPALVSLAQGIPAHVWLTELRYQPPSLILTGYAATLPALSAMRDALGQITGFRPGSAGELQQDEQGRWRFIFQLQSQG